MVESVSKGSKDPLLIGAYCRRLMDTGDMAQAEKLLCKAIGRQWDGELVRLYGLIQTEQPGGQIRVAEGWAKTRPEDPDLLTTLARLYLHAGNRDRARTLLVDAARHGGGRETYMELGLLLEAAGDGDKALQYYRRGLERLDQPAEPMPVVSGGELLPPVSEQTDSS